MSDFAQMKAIQFLGGNNRQNIISFSLDEIIDLLHIVKTISLIFG